MCLAARPRRALHQDISVKCSQGAGNRPISSSRHERTAIVSITPQCDPADVSSERVRRKPRSLQPLPIRLVHWLNAMLLILMTGSGLQILAAYPSFGPQGEQYRWYPFQGRPPPKWLRIGGWLGGAHHWHFAIAWFLVLNGVTYVIYLLASGEWRRRWFQPARDAKNAIAQFVYYLRLRPTPPAPDFYNGLQRLAYSSVILFALTMVLSGLALYKPVQLHGLTLLFGGYDGARVTCPPKSGPAEM